MKVRGKRRVVTSELVEDVQSDIEKERAQRGARLTTAIQRYAELSEGLAHSEHATILDVTRALWLALMSLGLLSVEYAISVRRRPPGQTTLHDEFGGSWKYHGETTFKLRSVFGVGSYSSSQYVRGNKPRPDRRVAAINSEVGLLPVDGGLCPLLALHCVDMSSRMPFDTASSVLKSFLGYAPSKRSLQGLVDLIGPLARRCLEEASCPRGDILLVMVDCRGLPYITEQELQRRCKPHTKRKKRKPSQIKRPAMRSKPRRGPGKKKPTRRVTVGLIIALHTDIEGNVVGKGERFYCSSFGNMEAVFPVLADKLSEQPTTPVYFVSDGCPILAGFRERHLPDATAILDFYHVCEYLWTAGRSVHREGSDELKAWVSMLKGFLLRGDPNVVLAILYAELDPLPRKSSKRKALNDAMKYLGERKEMMPYPALLERGIDIGSGAIESAVRQIVELRFDGPGMKWGDDRPQHMLDLVCARLSGLSGRLEEAVADAATNVIEIQRMTNPGKNERSAAPHAGFIRQAA